MILPGMKESNSADFVVIACSKKTFIHNAADQIILQEFDNQDQSSHTDLK